MEHLNCRGNQTRIEIVNQYDLRLIIYAKLLNGKIKHSDANETLTDRYYEFECALKSNKNVIKAITCGSGAGEHLLKLAEIDRPPIFDPFKSEGTGSHSGNGGNNGNSRTWDPLAKELYNAIRWLICCWDIVPYGKLLKIKEDLEKYKNEPHMWKIEFVNKIISNDAKNRTITQMIEEVINDGNNIRKFSFELINRKLQENRIDSYF